MICEAVSMWPSHGSTEFDDSDETFVAISMQPNSTMIPIKDWIYDARLGSSSRLMSTPCSYLVGKGLGANFGNLYCGVKFSDM